MERPRELPLARRAVSRRDVHELVAMDWFLGDRLDPVVAEPRLLTADGLEQLRTGGARLADDVECLVAPMGRHLAASRAGVLSGTDPREQDRKSTRLNSSHGYISYAVFCLKKKKRCRDTTPSHMACGSIWLSAQSRRSHACPATIHFSTWLIASRLLCDA